MKVSREAPSALATHELAHGDAFVDHTVAVVTDDDMMNIIAMIITTTIIMTNHAHHHHDHLLKRARDPGAATAVRDELRSYLKGFPLTHDELQS